MDLNLLFHYLRRCNKPISEKPLLNRSMYKKKKRLTYVSPSSVVNPSFWNKLTELKLTDGLEETERPLWGYINLITNDNLLTPVVEIDSTSFNDTPKDTNVPQANCSGANNKSKNLGANLPQAHSSREKNISKIHGPEVAQAQCSEENSKSKSLGSNVPTAHSSGENNKSKTHGPEVSQAQFSDENKTTKILSCNVPATHSSGAIKTHRLDLGGDLPTPNLSSANRSKTHGPDAFQAYFSRENNSSSVSKNLSANLPEAHSSKEKNISKIHGPDVPQAQFSEENKTAKILSCNVPAAHSSGAINMFETHGLDLGLDLPRPNLSAANRSKTHGPDAFQAYFSRENNSSNVSENLSANLPDAHSSREKNISKIDGPEVPQAQCSEENNKSKTLGYNVPTAHSSGGNNKSKTHGPEVPQVQLSEENKTAKIVSSNVRAAHSTRAIHKFKTHGLNLGLYLPRPNLSSANRPKTHGPDAFQAYFSREDNSFNVSKSHSANLPETHSSREKNISKIHGPEVPQAQCSEENNKSKTLGSNVPRALSSGGNNKSKTHGPEVPQAQFSEENKTAKVLSSNVPAAHSSRAIHKFETLGLDFPRPNLSSANRSRTHDPNAFRAYFSRENNSSNVSKSLSANLPEAHSSREKNISKIHGPEAPQAQCSEENNKSKTRGSNVPTAHSSGENNKSKTHGSEVPQAQFSEENKTAKILSSNVPAAHSSGAINMFKPHGLDLPGPNLSSANRCKTHGPNAFQAYFSRENNSSKTLGTNVPEGHCLKENKSKTLGPKDPQAHCSGFENYNSKSCGPYIPQSHCSEGNNNSKTVGPDVFQAHHSGENINSKTIGPNVPQAQSPEENNKSKTPGIDIPQAHSSRENNQSKSLGPNNYCEFNSQNIYLPLYGKIANKNTIEQFRECNKLTFLQKEGAQLYEKIISGEALEKPVILNCFVILAYANFKKHSYRYWFAFPVLNKVAIEKVQTHQITNVFKEDERLLILNEFMKLDNIQKPYFLVDTKLSYRKKKIAVRPIADIRNLSWRIWPDIYFGFFNISTHEKKVGSQLRNLVALIAYYCPYLKNTNQKFLALRCKREREDSKITIEHSSIYTLRIPNVSEHDLKSCIGWEKNFQDKLGPKVANLRNLDPLQLAECSVDLNLKLMKWRAVPEIDLEKIKNTKCLLLGSGTLGCSVARSLLAWGVRYITLVDSATVSFSNPVRQSLFTYEDSVKMRIKSEAAAERLKQIFPGVISEGVHLAIPMPGHSISPDLAPQVTDNIQRLVHLINCADIIFLLMDSRESRWLPAMLGNYFGKTVINAAVGFDSYLVMRHGYKNDAAGAPSTCEVNGYKIIQGHNLGCYFCNDIRAPGDTMRNRTLDQQCTVSRPGVAQIASALAVELAVSILQHREDRNAPAFYKMSNQGDEPNPEAENPGLLGLVPHSIRGFLSHYEQIIPATLKYDQCVACSDFVLDEYRNRGMEFLFQVFNSSKHLEDVTKLTDMFCQINPDDVLVLDDETSDSD